MLGNTLSRQLNFAKKNYRHGIEIELDEKMLCVKDKVKESILYPENCDGDIDGEVDPNIKLVGRCTQTQMSVS